MSRLTITERRNGEFTILDLSGDITFGEGNIRLRNAIRQALGEGKKHFLLNFEGVGYIDSSGIGELVSALIAVNRERGRLRLLNLTSRAEELLTICKLLTIFEVCEKETESAGSVR